MYLRTRSKLAQYPGRTLVNLQAHSILKHSLKHFERSGDKEKFKAALNQAISFRGEPRKWETADALRIYQELLRDPTKRAFTQAVDGALAKRDSKRRRIEQNDEIESLKIIRKGEAAEVFSSVE